MLRWVGFRAFSGGHMMIPMPEVLRLRTSRSVKRTPASDRLHDASAQLGSDDGLSREGLDALEAARPGRAPWDLK